VTLLCWIALLVVGRERLELPPFAWPLAGYMAWTLLAVAFSLHPARSLSDQRELLLFLIVPAVYRIARGKRALTVLEVLISIGAISALIGVFEYGVLNYDTLGRRPQGTLGHYMTYSGTLMLAIGAATARVLFRKEQRTWPALVLPVLVVALSLTFTRSAWVGACVAVGLLFVLKDLRLLGVLPVLAAIFFATAPAALTARVYSTFNLNDPTNRDRLAMAQAGLHMVRDHPIFGLGPAMVAEVYPEYREPDAVEPLNPHLHNVPMEIAAERGLPALALWIWFVLAAALALWRRFRNGPYPALAGAGLAALASMLAAGLFEYNFGDSEFLIPFLVLITLAFAAERGDRDAAVPAP
jgi:O-antigen ligase